MSRTIIIAIFLNKEQSYPKIMWQPVLFSNSLRNWLLNFESWSAKRKKFSLGNLASLSELKRFVQN